jgi:hypothetical protein
MMMILEMIFKPYPIWLGVVVLLLLAAPIGIFLLRRFLSLRAVARIMLLVAFIISCLLSLPMLAWATVCLSDKFEGPGIWLFFAIYVLAVQIVLTAVAGTIAFCGMKTK